jgi:hypothetical protein
VAKSTTERSLAWLRTRGYVTDVTEHFKAGKKHDLFGLFDIAAIHVRFPKLVFVQTTTSSNARARMKKINASHLSPLLLQAGVRVIVHACDDGYVDARELILNNVTGETEWTLART